MPHHPHVNPAAEAISELLFSELAEQLAQYQGETYPLYVGDTWLQPPRELHVSNLTPEEYGDLYRYPPSYGRLDLLSLLAQRLTKRLNMDVSPGNLLISAGGTGAVATVVGSLVSPGEDVIVLGPHWPLITGHVTMWGGHPVVVPFWGIADSPASVTSILEDAITTRTTGIYLNTPNNPTGHVFPEPWLRSLVEVARRHSLWIISDEAYDEFAYARPHCSPFTLAPERTFCIYSTSKAFGFAGGRCGYALGPRDQIHTARKINTHISYGAPMVAQLALRNLLSEAHAAEKWLANTRAQYQAVGDRVAERLQAPKPEGGQYLFVDIGPRLGGASDLSSFLRSCVERGTLVTPGTFFGPYPTSIRICFTCSPPDDILRGVEILAQILGL